MQIKENKLLNENIFIKKLSSGVKCYIIPKYDYVEKQVILGVKYGSIDNEFKQECDTGITSVPKGIAHYLEHKMFEDESGNVFEIFSKLGSVVNAFTSANMTGYYFNCTDNFHDNLTELLKFIQRPYFTDENVEKEKGIIEQEIIMYEDNPNFKLYYNMLNAMYHNHPVKDNIAGSLDSIKKINKELLYKCYDTFYNPSNMVVVCVGNLDPSELFKIIDSKIQTKDSKEIVRFYQEEPSSVKENTITEKMPVVVPIYMIGIKENTTNTNKEWKNIASAKILLDIIIGESSPLFQLLYNKGLTDNSLGFDYVAGTNYAHSIIAGSSKKPESLKEYFINEIKKLKNEGISDKHFDRIKKKHIGRSIRGFNNIGAIAMSQMDLASKGLDLFDLMDYFGNLTKEDIIDYLENTYKEENITLSVVHGEN